MDKHEVAALLNGCDMRVTKNRTDVLLFMEKQKYPVGIDVLSKEFPAVNVATLYRMATDFVEKGIWNSHDLGRGHVDFESANRPHHHHLVCERCGVVEDVAICIEDTLNEKALRSGTNFAQVTRHSTTFFGICETCS